MKPVTVIAVGDTDAAVVEELAQQEGRLHIVRRCPELPELLAACQSGLAQVAFVARFSGDLTATLVDRLTAVGVSVVAVADSPEEAQRLRGIGATPVAAHVAAASLVGVVCAAVEDRRHPGHSGYAVASAETALPPGRAMPSDHTGVAAPLRTNAAGGGDNGGNDAGPGHETDSTGGSPPDAYAGDDDAGGTGNENAAEPPEDNLQLRRPEKVAEDGSPPQDSSLPERTASWRAMIIANLRPGRNRDSVREADRAAAPRRKLRKKVSRRAASSTHPAVGTSARRSAAVDAAGLGGTPGSVPGRIVAVWGPIGSPGRTTVAVNLAAEQAAAGRKVMLIDADSYGASIASTLGLLDESASFAQACRAADQGALSPAALAKITTELVFSGGTFSLLTGLTRADRWPELRAAAVERVLGLARGMAELVVVDCGFGLENDEELSYDTVAPRRNAATLAVLSQAELIYAVGNSDPVGIPRLIKGLGELAEACPGADVRVVANKVRRKAVGGSPEKALAQAWDRFGPAMGISHFLPWDPELTDKALLEGRLLLEIAPDAPLRRAIRDITCAAEQQNSKVAVAKATAKLEVQG